MFFVVFLSLDRLLKSDAVFRDFGFGVEKPFVVGIRLLLILGTPVFTFAKLPMNFIIRRFEYQTDEFATRKGLNLAEALVKLSTENKAVVGSDPLYAAFNESHPAIHDRVAAIRRVEAKTK
jgi:STE24 endopeptidase